jgi:2-dehydropantoate 2-reductase
MIDQPLHILVFGAGAIGTYIGGSLALDGHPVVFVERPQVCDELRQHGLNLKLGETRRILQDVIIVPSNEEALNLGPFDIAIFALKSFDTQAALETFKPHAAAFPPILCLSNGVDNEPALAQCLGAEKVIAGTITSAVGRQAAGDIILERLRGVGIADGHPLSERLVTTLDKAGLKARLFKNSASMKWSKLLTNLLANSSSAILDMSPAEIFSHPGLYNFELLQLREALEVMHMKGIQVVDLPSTPVRLLAFAVRRLPPRLSRPFLRRAVGSGRGGKMPSLYIDIQSGRGQSEVDFLNGAVVRQGESLNVPTPINRLLNETLLALVNGDMPKEIFAHQPEKFLRLSPFNRKTD